MAALERAVAVAEVDERAMEVAEDLHLDMARIADVALQQQPLVAERPRRLASSCGERGAKLRLGRDNADPLAAPPATGLTSTG